MLSTHPTIVSQSVNQTEHIGVVQRPAVGLRPPRNAHTLKMPDALEQPFNRRAHLTFHPLHMINVILQFDRRIARLIQNANAISRTIQKLSRHAVVIDWLNEQSQPGLTHLLSGKTQILNLRSRCDIPFQIVRLDAR